ncbi:MAG: cupredoxin family copper-binding protein [Methanosarcinaceae archaeon]|nr:cupredoxin family copper-binding protein [Methanosarcinaceae archaeon]
MVKVLVQLVVIVLVAAVLLASGCTDYGSKSDSGASINDTKKDEINEVSIKNFEFQPQNIRILAGDSVTWNNDDSVTHTVTSDNDEFDSGNLGPGDSYTHIFEEPGNYSYSCKLHPTMVGTVTVE